MTPELSVSNRMTRRSSRGLVGHRLLLSKDGETPRP
jgi:hypothetical protein